MERNGWIVDPPAHRAAWRENVSGLDGTVRDTAIGEAVMIVPPAPPDDEWICDFCNAVIPVMSKSPHPLVVAEALIRGVPVPDEYEEASPVLVPQLGSYALCIDCAKGTGEFPESFIGLCVCPGCRAKLEHDAAEQDMEFREWGAFVVGVLQRFYERSLDG